MQVRHPNAALAAAGAKSNARHGFAAACCHELATSRCALPRAYPVRPRATPARISSSARADMGWVRMSVWIRAGGAAAVRSMCTAPTGRWTTEASTKTRGPPPNPPLSSTKALRQQRRGRLLAARRREAIEVGPARWDEPVGEQGNANTPPQCPLPQAAPTVARQSAAVRHPTETSAYVSRVAISYLFRPAPSETSSREPVRSQQYCRIKPTHEPERETIELGRNQVCRAQCPPAT